MSNEKAAEDIFDSDIFEVNLECPAKEEIAILKSKLAVAEAGSGFCLSIMQDVADDSIKNIKETVSLSFALRKKQEECEALKKENKSYKTSMVFLYVLLSLIVATYAAVEFFC